MTLAVFSILNMDNQSFPSHRVRKNRRILLDMEQARKLTNSDFHIIRDCSRVCKQETPTPDGLPDALISYILVLDPL